MLIPASRDERTQPAGAALTIARILVVVDPGAEHHPCIDKAASIAANLGASLELYVCDTAPLAEEQRAVRRQFCEDLLGSLAAPLRARGLRVNSRYEWHAPLERGIGVHVVRTRPDLVVKDTHAHAPQSHGAVTRTDWLLISQLPAPLLLVRPTPWAPRLRVAVATDPCHPAYRPESLDERLVATACLLANATGGAAAAIHVLQTPPHLPGEAVPAIERARAHGEARDAVESLVAKANNQDAPMPVHFTEGGVTQGIVAATAARPVDLLVVGAAARGRWQGGTAGGTAARILEDVACDVLIIKPHGFVSPLLITD